MLKTMLALGAAVAMFAVTAAAQAPSALPIPGLPKPPAKGKISSAAVMPVTPAE